MEHPSYLAEIPDNLGSSSSSSQGALGALASSSSSSHSDRRGRKSRNSGIDTELPDLTSLTGFEYVPVIHRESGKRLTGSKAPTLVQLSVWLEKHSSYDVDPAWGTLVKVSLTRKLVLVSGFSGFKL